MLKLPVVALDTKRIDMIADSCDYTPAGDRDSAFIRFLYGTGLRISEALALTKDDIDYDRHTITVRNGKNGKTRIAAASDDALTAASPYFAHAKRNEPLWGITSSGIRKRMSRLARKLDMPRLHAHSLRHAHAVKLAKNGASINYIQQQLGHANIGTTSLYLQRYNPDERILAITSALNGDA